MRKLKVIMLIVFVILLFSKNKVLATSATVSLNADNTTAKPNDLILVSLSANCDDGLSFISTNINYDSEVLTLQTKTIDPNWINYGQEKLELFVNSNNKIKNATVCTFIFKVNENAKAGNTKIETTEIDIIDINNNEYTKPKSMVELTINIGNTIEANNENNTINNAGNNTASNNTETFQNQSEGNINKATTPKANNTSKNNNNHINTTEPQATKDTNNVITEENGQNNIENGDKIILTEQLEPQESENTLTIGIIEQNNNTKQNNYMQEIIIRIIICIIFIILIVLLLIFIIKKRPKT